MRWLKLQLVILIIKSVSPFLEIIIESVYRCFDVNLQLAFAICSCRRHIQDPVSTGMDCYIDEEVV